MDSAWRRGLVFAASLAVAFFLIYEAILLKIADARIESTQFDTMKQAAAIEPDNADYWDRLGRFKELDFAQHDLPQALLDFQRAVALNPHDAQYWIDLSGGYEASGDRTRARDALESARAAYPASADVLWNYGNFLVREGDYADGFRQIREAVVIDPRLTTEAISRTWRSTQDVNVLIREVLPANVESYFAALNFFASIQDAAPGLAIWRRIVDLKAPFRPDRVFSYLDELIREDKVQEAQEVWRDALGNSGMQASDSPNGSVVTDGRFDGDFPNGGFGWRVSDIPGVLVDFDSTTYHSPPRSLRLDFGGGTNLDLWEPYQIVPVTPNRRYQFQAFLRTDSISTESGITFYIFDPEHSAPSAMTEGLTRSHDWTPVTAALTTGPETHVLRISVRRAPSRLFENRLSGTVWIDDVSLEPTDSGGEANSK